MKVINIGSLNLDYVYQVDHIIEPGETESTGKRNVFLGGKGINQAGLMEGMPIPEILRMSARASAIAVTRNGAVPSIPYRAEVMEALKEERYS